MFVANYKPVTMNDDINRVCIALLNTYYCQMDRKENLWRPEGSKSLVFFRHYYLKCDVQTFGTNVISMVPILITFFITVLT